AEAKALQRPLADGTLTVLGVDAAC
ncbi:MAG: hypothetical protein RIS17_412, partial [Pseudomonadota bacterium]